MPCGCRICGEQGGGPAGDGLTDLCRATGLDLSAGEIISDTDDHGGFHGDGTRLTVVQWDQAPEAGWEAAGWSPLPLDETTSVIVYGKTTREETEDGAAETAWGPYITVEAGGKPSIPPVEHGYYYFRDRFPADGPDGGKPILERAACNFTVAIYDSDSNTLYYGGLDT